MREKDAFWVIRDEYDKVMSRKIQRRRAIAAELDARCAAEDLLDMEALAEKVHEAYNSGALNKTELRNATRQYGSPKFMEIWNARPYEGTRIRTDNSVSDYILDGNTLYVQGDNWDWTGLDVATKELQFEIKYSEDLGKNYASWPGDSLVHATFNMKNNTKINRAVNS